MIAKLFTDSSNEELIAKLTMHAVTFDESQAFVAGLLRSLFGLGLARSTRLPVLTADRIWSRITIDIDVQLIR